MTRHVDFEKQIAVYRSLDAPERIAVDRHVSACASCAAVYARYAVMDDKLAALPKLPAPASLRVYTEAGLPGAARSGRREAPAVGWWQAVSPSFTPAVAIGLALVGLWLVVSLVSGPDRGGFLPPTRTPTATLAVTGTMATGTALATSVSWAPAQDTRRGAAPGSTAAGSGALVPPVAPLPTPGTR